jgi:hypothetical protein
VPEPLGVDPDWPAVEPLPPDAAVDDVEPLPPPDAPSLAVLPIDPTVAGEPDSCDGWTAPGTEVGKLGHVVSALAVPERAVARAMPTTRAPLPVAMATGARVKNFNIWISLS